MGAECAQDSLQVPQSQVPRRTKLVFLYSSDEEEGPSESARAPFAVEEAPGLNPPEEELRAMQAEANTAAVRDTQSADDFPLPPSPFVEDTVGVPCAREPVGAKNRVKVVEVPPLVENYTFRRHLNPAEVERLGQSRKQFSYDEEEEKEEEKEEETVAEKERGIEASEWPRPIVDGDGLVTAVAVGGYQLTVDEHQLQGDDDEEEEEEGDGEAFACADEDFEDEEDDELDDAIVVAVVEQLVRCCKSDDLDEALREDGHRFLERAMPFLERLHAEEMSLEVFGEEMRGDILRLQRAYQRVNRPKDAPIVIDGVVMDM